MEMDAETISGFFEDNTTNFSSSAASPDDIFSVLEAWENASDGDAGGRSESLSFEFQKSSSGAAAAAAPRNSDPDSSSSAAKRRKLTNSASASASQMEEGQNRISHITVERNRRKQMNEHLSVLRSLMPCFYVKRGDQASIIGGVVDYINELQQVLQSLEAKKQRKSAYNDVVLSPRIVSSSPRPLPLSPRLPPLSPRTPQSSAPYKPWMHHSPSLPSPVDPSPTNSSASSSVNDAVNELVATSKSALAEVEVKFSGPNLLLKTVSHRLAPPGQVLKIVSALEELALEILHVSISTVDETVLNSFTIKIGIQCQLSAEELAEQIQHTFCS